MTGKADNMQGGKDGGEEKLLPLYIHMHTYMYNTCNNIEEVLQMAVAYAPTTESSAFGCMFLVHVYLYMPCFIHVHQTHNQLTSFSAVPQR